MKGIPTEGRVYHISDSYFSKAIRYDPANDRNLLKNKENNGSRPTLFVEADKKNPNILWMVPLSTRIDKYEGIRQCKIDRFNECLSIEIGVCGGKKSAFLLQNMFPVTKDYIVNAHRSNGNAAVSVTPAEHSAIRMNMKQLRFNSLKQRQVFPDIRKLTDMLIDEQRSLDRAVGHVDGSLAVQSTDTQARLDGRRVEARAQPPNQSPIIIPFEQFLSENGNKVQAAAFAGIVGNVKMMEDSLKACDTAIKGIKAQLKNSAPLQGQAIKDTLQETLGLMEKNYRAINGLVIEIKDGFIDGCRTALMAANTANMTDSTHKGADITLNPATFFALKEICSKIEARADLAIKRSERAIERLVKFTGEYGNSEQSGRAVRGNGVFTGKDPLENQMRLNELANALKAPHESIIAKNTAIKDMARDCSAKLEALSVRGDSVKSNQTERKPTRTRNAQRQQRPQRPPPKPPAPKKPTFEERMASAKARVEAQGRSGADRAQNVNLSEVR